MQEIKSDVKDKDLILFMSFIFLVSLVLAFYCFLEIDNYQEQLKIEVQVLTTIGAIAGAFIIYLLTKKD